MKKKFIVALDFGSSEIRLLAGLHGEALKVVIAYKLCEKYEGFVDGEFFEPESLFEILQKLISSAEYQLNTTIKEVVIGVPAEFCAIKTKKVNVTFTNYKKLSNEYLLSIYSKMIDDLEGYTNVSADVVYHQLDDADFYQEIEKMKASKVSSLLCLSYVKNTFIEKINSILKRINISRVEYKSSTLCECQKAFRQTHENDFVLVDVGYLTTSVCEVKNGLPIHMMSFSLGGGHLMGDMYEYFDLDCDEAEQLKRKLILSLKSTTTDFYTINKKHISSKLANTIAIERIKFIAFYINECLKTFDNKTFQIYLTGGGLCLVKGVKEILKRELCCDVDFILPDNIEYSSPNEFSEISLLESLII